MIIWEGENSRSCSIQNQLLCQFNPSYQSKTIAAPERCQNPTLWKSLSTYLRKRTSALTEVHDSNRQTKPTRKYPND